MNLEKLLESFTYYAQIGWSNHVTLYVLIGLGVMGYLILWVCNVRALDHIGENAAMARASIHAVKGLSETVEQMRQVLDSRNLALAPACSSDELNPTVNSQAVVMHHRGEPVESIAAALGKPKNEIELLLKLNRLLGAAGSRG